MEVSTKSFNQTALSDAEPKDGVCVCGGGQGTEMGEGGGGNGSCKQELK